MTQTPPDNKPLAKSASPNEPPQRPVLQLSDLLAGGREAIIVHGGEHYRLRVTANGKLILTK